ncbi:TPA: hypothetical protein ACH3X3_007064 [Trebouxia sp. C0006]
MARWRKQRPLICFASQSKGSVTDLYRLLGVSASSSKADIRAAYISKIKVMHPDVSADDDATEDAVALNAAYTALMEQHVDYDEEDDLLDVFDISEAEPDLLFINPFGCQMDPLLWRELQDYAQSAPDSRLLEDHLLAAGLSMTSSAIAWLTPAQLLTVQKELERMEEQLSFETTAWWLSDVLMRARVTNSRMSRAGANRW